MTLQIAVRLPEHLVGYIDELVAAGDASSRAAAISKSLERDLRRTVAERDAAILAARGGYPDLDGLVHFGTHTPMNLD